MLPGIRAVFVLSVVVLLCCSRASAWSYKEHILFTRLAVVRILDDPNASPAMKEWLRDALGEVPSREQLEQFFFTARIGIRPEGMTGLSYWAYAPDIHANSDPAAVKVEPFGVHERFLHFVDLELLTAGEGRRAYKHDLSNKPRIEDIPKNRSDPRYIQAGMLPFRVEHCYEQLVQSIRERRLHAPSTNEQEGKTATYWAGYLAHYVADNTQPQHSTVDYKSQSYFAVPSRAPNVHAEVEYRMCDDEMNDYMDLRKEYWPMFVKQLAVDDPVKTDDAWQGTIEVSLRSYDALPLIGLAAMQAARQGGTPEKPTGARAAQFDTEAFFRFRGNYLGREMNVIEMKAIQTAWAVRRIERFFRQAWEAGTTPPLSR